MFNDLIDSDNLPWVIVYGGENVVQAVSLKLKAEFSIKNGKLYQTMPEVEPPEAETGLSVDMFNDESPVFKLAENKDSFLENLDWNNVSYDYLTAYFRQFYDNFASTIDKPATENGWAIYRMSENLYLYSNGKSWFDNAWNSRVYVGQTFVIKRSGR